MANKLIIRIFWKLTFGITSISDLRYQKWNLVLPCILCRVMHNNIHPEKISFGAYYYALMCKSEQWYRISFRLYSLPCSSKTLMQIKLFKIKKKIVCITPQTYWLKFPKYTKISETDDPFGTNNCHHFQAISNFFKNPTCMFMERSYFWSVGGRGIKDEINNANTAQMIYTSRFQNFPGENLITWIC